jgi:hypothetical protein
MTRQLISRLLPLFLFVSFLVSDTKAQDVYHGLITATDYNTSSGHIGTVTITNITENGYDGLGGSPGYGTNSGLCAFALFNYSSYVGPTYASTPTYCH